MDEPKISKNPCDNPKGLLIPEVAFGDPRNFKAGWLYSSLFCRFDIDDKSHKIFAEKHIKLENACAERTDLIYGWMNECSNGQ